jgi:glycosyltransferase involved in cell wall biosynthesis
MDVERVDPARRLRIAVLADFDGPHARSWVRWFIARGHDIHAVSFYPPRTAVEGATMHALQPGAAGSDTLRTVRRTTSRVPRGPARLAHAMRYRRSGLRDVLRQIDPDVFHAHYLVEHGFYGAFAGVRPYAVTAWGSDALVEPQRDPMSRWIAKWVLGRADLVTSNNAYMAQRIVELGAPASKLEVVVLGAERYDMERAAESVNRAMDASGELTVISTRAHEPLYNIGEIIEAYGRVAHARADVKLVVAHGGSLTARLQERAREEGGRVEFFGYLDRATFREALTNAHVFVSVPSSDGTSVALLQAMAAGAFPIVSDLPTQHEWIDDGVNGFRVPLHRPDALAERMSRALADGDLRRRAADHNRRLVEERGLNETQMARMEDLYHHLVATHATHR